MSSPSGSASRPCSISRTRSSARSASTVLDAFPAALLAPVWRALLEAGVIEAPTRVDLDRVEVLLVGPKQLELRVPVRSRSGELVKAVPVMVRRWSSSGELRNVLHEEATNLARALERAASQPVVDLGGSGQKPRN